MARHRLLWTLFPSYVVVIILCCGATGLFAWQTFRQYHIRQTIQTLDLRAQLVRDDVKHLLGQSSQPDLDAMVRRFGRFDNTRITLVDPAGNVLADNETQPDSDRPNHADRPEIQAALVGRVGQGLRYSDTLGAELQYVAIPLYRDGRVVMAVRTAVPLADVQHATQTVLVPLGLAGASVAAVAVLLVLVMARRLSKPIERIREGADRFARGDLAHRLYVPGTAETASLADSLNRMAAQLDDRIRIIREQAAQQEAVLASMTEGVLAVDSEQHVLSVNAAASALLGMPLPAAVGRSLHEVIRNADLDQLVAKVLRTGAPAESEIVLRGQVDRTLQVHATVLRDTRPGHSRNIGALVVLDDVTRLRRLERVRQDFVANVSHELKTPITSIKGFVETLRDGAVDDPAQAHRFLEIINAQVDRLSSIIDDLLTLSRIEQEPQRQQIRLEPAAVRRPMAAAIRACESAAASKNITVGLDCPEDLAAPINASLLEQAVGNLIANAIQYSDPGKTVLVRAARNGNAMVDIAVQDFGSGISSEHLPRLFERFYRVDKARSRKLGGTGLGLAIVKHIVAAHHGDVSVTSTPGQGSTFTIHLPTENVT